MFNSQAQQRPKLVVGIVVDQMKMEYLYRFSDDFLQMDLKDLNALWMLVFHNEAAHEKRTDIRQLSLSRYP
jgi:hypothetical protein